jgi:quercetin dioxygenase-like cupin family protein
MSQSIVHLEDGGSVDPRGLLRGAWREIAVRRVEPGGTYRLAAEDAEHAAYIWSGSGTATTGEGSMSAGAGSAFTIVKGDEVAFEAGSEGMRLFVTTFDA